MRPSGRTGTTRVSSGSCHTTTSSTSSRPIRYSPTSGRSAARSDGRVDAHAAARSTPATTTLFGRTIRAPPASTRQNRGPTEHGACHLSDRHLPAHRERRLDAHSGGRSGAQRTAERRARRDARRPRRANRFPHARNGAARVAAGAPAHDVPRGRRRGPQGRRRRPTRGAQMLRATVWTVGLFGAGTAISRVLPGTWTEPLVLFALGLALLFVSARTARGTATRAGDGSIANVNVNVTPKPEAAPMAAAASVQVERTA